MREVEFSEKGIEITEGEEKKKVEKENVDEEIIFNKKEDRYIRIEAAWVKAEEEIKPRLKEGKATNEDLLWLKRLLEKGGPLDDGRACANYERAKNLVDYLIEKVDNQLKGVKEVIDEDHERLWVIDRMLENLEENRPEREKYESRGRRGETYMSPEGLREYEVDLIEWNADRNALLLEKIALLIKIHRPEGHDELEDTTKEITEGLKKETEEE